MNYILTFMLGVTLVMLVVVCVQLGNMAHRIDVNVHEFSNPKVSIQSRYESLDQLSQLINNTDQLVKDTDQLVNDTDQLVNDLDKLMNDYKEVKNGS